MSEAVESGDHGWRAVALAYMGRRYTVLFYLLLMTMVAVPLVATLELPGTLIEFFLAASLLAAVIPVGTVESRRGLLTITVLLWVARPVTAWFDLPLLSAISLGLWTLIALFAAAGALRFALRATQVDAEHLYAALSAYLLAGIFFGVLYWVLEQIGPGTFAGADKFTRMSALYFSFVTLATVGYGDIVPRTDVARGLAIVEGVRRTAIPGGVGCTLGQPLHSGERSQLKRTNPLTPNPLPLA